VSAENVAIVKSSWAGWRQGLEEQMVRDFEEGVEDSIREWAESQGNPDLQPEEFIDNGDEILVRARAAGRDASLCFRYTMSGPRIVRWEVV
jgi:hypothetical protein